MIRTSRRVLAAGAAMAAFASTSTSAQAFTGPMHLLPRCGQTACSTHMLRLEIRRLRHRAVRVRDQRGLLGVHLRHARLHGDPFRLYAERHHWRSTIHSLRHRAPLWRTLRRWDDWMCIHAREGAWNSIDGLYHGGLQMDPSFQASYGSDMVLRYGSAERWPVAAQVAVAERAYHVRGYTPWPNTARGCGVL
jgi:hypothetical protein